MGEERAFLTKEEIEQIKMVNETASQAASAALSKMISKDVKSSSLSLSLKPIDEVKKIETNYLLALSEVTGDLSGNMLASHPLDNGLKLVDLMMMQAPGTCTQIDETAISAYKEFVNIIGGAYLSNIANFLGFRVFPQVPKFIGSMGEVQRNLLTELEQDIGKLLLIKSEMVVETEKISGYFFVILDESSLKKIITTIRGG